MEDDIYSNLISKVCMPIKCACTVVGAGIGGLSIAALLVHSGIPVTVFEKSDKVGGRTSSMVFRNHILDNGFHIMPFYKKSAIYGIFKKLEIESNLKLIKVKNIAFYDRSKFYNYPKGIGDILNLKLVSFSNRIKLLKILLPLAFSSIKKSERWDSIPLTRITKDLDQDTRSFFDAVCMLAFADVPDHISLGEFARTIMRANPLRGGTSEFGYPQNGGYDTIAKILSHNIEKVGGMNSIIKLNSRVQKIIVKDRSVKGVVTSDGAFVPSDCVIVSYPAYLAINDLFEQGTFDHEFITKVNKLNVTTSVVEVHFALSKKIDERQVVFPVGNDFTAKGIFFISNITRSVSPKGEHLVLAGTPTSSEDAGKPESIRRISNAMKSDLEKMYPHFKASLIWERPMAWQLVESVVKKPGVVWKQKMPHEVNEQVKGLFFVGDSTVSYGIGTDSAAHSALLCHPKIRSYLSSLR